MYGRPGLRDPLGVTGTPEQCAQELRRLAGAGAEELVLAPMYAHLAQLDVLVEVGRVLRGTD
jgi:alkanesulfonate monooxygenase SsuD/methylene tetrahydromethanopterin reductase-like flavin-dependent oxidoreductase (luciferase family)